MCNFLDVFPSFLHFSVERFGKFSFIFYLCPRLSLLFAVRRKSLHDGILRPTVSFVGQAEGEGVYGRYHSVSSNFAHLKLRTEVMQRERLRG